MKAAFAAAFALGYLFLVPLCFANPVPMADGMPMHGSCAAQELAHHFGVYDDATTACLTTAGAHVSTIAAAVPIAFALPLIAPLPALPRAHARRSRTARIRKRDAAWIARHQNSPPAGR